MEGYESIDLDCVSSAELEILKAEHKAQLEDKYSTTTSQQIDCPVVVNQEPESKRQFADTYETNKLERCTTEVYSGPHKLDSELS